MFAFSKFFQSPEPKTQAVEKEPVFYRAADRAAYQLARKVANEISKRYEQAISVGELREDDLKNPRYSPIPSTKPQKYNSAIDDFCNRELPKIQEPAISNSDNNIVFLMTSDANGYVPRHIDEYNQPLTGDYQTDLMHSRSKRVFRDNVARQAAKNRTKPYLVQPYLRDTGQMLLDLSVPLFVNGWHYGCVRVGYTV